MTIALQDPTDQRDPSSPHAFPDVVGEPKLRAPGTLAEELLAGFRDGEQHPRSQSNRDPKKRTPRTRP